MQVLSNLYNASSQARTKQSLQDDKSFWNPIIRHKSISKNLHGKQCALGESVAKNSQKSGSEHAGLCDCWQQAVHSARQHSKRGEWLWERFKNKRVFHLFPGQPNALLSSTVLTEPPELFLYAQGTFWCLFQRRRICIGVGEGSWGWRGKDRDISVLLQVLPGSLVLLSVSLEKGWWVKSTSVGFGISLPFCVVSSIGISLRIISWLGVVLGQH